MPREKSMDFEKISKADTPLDKLIRKKERRDTITNVGNVREYITTGPMGIKCIK